MNEPEHTENQREKYLGMITLQEALKLVDQDLHRLWQESKEKKKDS